MKKLIATLIAINLFVGGAQALKCPIVPAGTTNDQPIDEGTHSWVVNVVGVIGTPTPRIDWNDSATSSYSLSSEKPVCIYDNVRLSMTSSGKFVCVKKKSIREPYICLTNEFIPREPEL
jgi:hypothetical protein